MKYKDFEDFLQFYHAENYPEILDDDLPDMYADWESELEQDDWIRLANEYGRRIQNSQ